MPIFIEYVSEYSMKPENRHKLQTFDNKRDDYK